MANDAMAHFLLESFAMKEPLLRAPGLEKLCPATYSLD